MSIVTKMFLITSGFSVQDVHMCLWSLVGTVCWVFSLFSFICNSLCNYFISSLHSVFSHIVMYSWL